MPQNETTSLASVLWKALIENFRLRVEDAIIAEINDPRNANFPDERKGLRMARIILNEEAHKFINDIGVKLTDR